MLAIWIVRLCLWLKAICIIRSTWIVYNANVYHAPPGFLGEFWIVCHNITNRLSLLFPLIPPHPQLVSSSLIVDVRQHVTLHGKERKPCALSPTPFQSLSWPIFRHKCCEPLKRTTSPSSSKAGTREESLCHWQDFALSCFDNLLQYSWASHNEVRNVSNHD